MTHPLIKINKVLIFGYPGFVAKHLKNFLAKKGLNVITSGRNLESKFEAGFFQCDVSNFESVARLIRLTQPDIIICAASHNQAIIDESQSLESYQTTVIGTLNLLESVKQHSSNSQVLFLSSKQEYGHVTILPVDELTQTNPISVYGKDKLIATNLVKFYKIEYGLNCSVFRISNLYGPNLQIARNKERIYKKNYNILSSFFYQAWDRKMIKIFGDGSQIKDYLFINDFCELVYSFISINKQNDAIYNVGSGTGISLLDAVKTIVKVRKTTIKFVVWPDDWIRVELGNYVTDISKIRNLTGWKPETSFMIGVSKTFQIIQEELTNQSNQDSKHEN